MHDETAKSGFNFHRRCKMLNISHMMFTYDLLMFARADHHSVETVFGAFPKFSEASGLVANPEKSNVYMVGVSDYEEQSIRSDLGMIKGSFPFKYLGVPLTSRKLKYTDYITCH